MSSEKVVGYLESVNIADDLDEQKLISIGDEVVRGYENDKRSRSDWETSCEDWMKLALQMAHKKTFPWENASNVKFPLISIAAMQFSARAYPSLVPQNGKIVNCRITGADPTGDKQKRANRINKHMSYQIMEEMEEWEEDMDKLLLVMSIVGVAFKKTYFDPTKERNVSRLVYATDLVVNNGAKSLDDVERITEVLYPSARKIKEKQLAGIYLDIDLGEPVQDEGPNGTSSTGDQDKTVVPYTILEQHTFLDLDEDGYAEPYIVTVDYRSKKVLRIVSRYKREGIVVDDQDKIIKIDPDMYYTKFGSIPNPSGSFYDIGFGHLLGPINDSVNTIINQLIDAGSLNNLQAGFIGKGLRMRMGDNKFKPGEWKAVNATGDDIKKQIFPLPTKEPSNVLFQLLGMLVTSGKELASVAEIMVGKMPGQNTPAYTTKETVEQGMKLFTAIYKRVYRSLKEEFRKLYKLNKIYLDAEREAEIIGEPIQQSDYTGPDKDIVPAADPSAASSTERMSKVQEIFPLMQLQTINPIELTKRALEAQEQPNMEALLAQPQPPAPDPKMQAVQAKAQMDMQKGQQQMQLAQQNAQLQMQMKAMEMKFKEMELMMKQREKEMELAMNMKSKQFELQSGAVGRMQDMKHNQDMFQLKAYAEQEKAKAAAEPKVREPKPPKKKVN